MHPDDDDAVVIETPEGVELRLALANVGSRLLAGVIDEVIRYVLIFATILAFAGFGLALDGLTSGGEEVAADDDDGGGGGDSVPYLAIAIILLVLFGVTFFYDVLFEVLAAGRTPGKMAIGIRVLRTNGDAITFLPSCIRNLLRLVDQLPFMYGVGMLSTLLTRRNQRLGDLAASTMVVRDRKAADTTQFVRRGTPPAWQTAVPAAPASAEVMTWDVSALTQEDLATIRHFLDRRHALGAEPRERIALAMAERVRARVAGAPPDLPPEELLEGVAAAKARRLDGAPAARSR